MRDRKEGPGPLLDAGPTSCLLTQAPKAALDPFMGFDSHQFTLLSTCKMKSSHFSSAFKACYDLVPTDLSGSPRCPTTLQASPDKCHAVPELGPVPQPTTLLPRRLSLIGQSSCVHGELGHVTPLAATRQPASLQTR